MLDPKFCVKCGSTLKDNAQFCPKCGTKTTNSERPSTTGNLKLVGKLVFGIIAIIIAITIFVGVALYFIGESETDSLLEEEQESTNQVDIIGTKDDRLIYYLSQSFDTPEKLQTTCQNWKDRAERDFEAGKLLTFTAQSYWQLCEIKEISWTQQTEEEFLNAGGKPLSQEEVSREINLILKEESGIQGSRSEYCQALRDWINEYQGSEWLTHNAQIEYDKVCS